MTSNTSDRSTLRALFIDDSVINLQMAKVQFERLSIACSLSQSAEDALSLMEKQIFSIIFCDISMPGMDGLEFTRCIRELEIEKKQRTPIIAVTSSVTAVDKAEYLRSGMDDAIEKPLSEESLLRAIRMYTSDDEVPSLANSPAQPETKQTADIPTTDPVDLSRLAALLGADDVTVLNDWIVIFRDLFPDLLSNITTAIQDKDARQLQAAAHKAKGAARSCAAVELAKLLGDLEADANEENWAEFEYRRGKILSEFARIEQYEAS